MIHNFLTIALRHFWTHKSYVIINIFGLGIGIAICTLAYHHLAYNLEFDYDYKQSTPNIYRIEKYISTEGRISEEALVTLPLTNLIARVPGVKQRIRYKDSYNNKVSIKVGDEFIKEGVYYADSGFFQVFKNQFVRGTELAFLDTNSIFITEKIAVKYFGTQDPMGRTLTLIYRNGKKKNLTIRAILKKLPDNNTFEFEIITRIENYLDALEVDETDWTHRRTTETYLEIPNLQDVPKVVSQFPDFVKKYNDINPTRAIHHLSLLPFSEVGIRSNHVSDRLTNGMMNYSFVGMICALAILILLIVCFNYTNTSIALASTRIKEISLRKVMGSERKQIIGQFLLEHFVISLAAVLFSFVLYDFLGSFYWSLWSNEGGYEDFSSYKHLWVFLIGILLFTTLISGAYPAFYISKLKTADTLRRNLKLKGDNLFTYTLLSFQLIITVVGLGLGIAFYENANYIDKLYRGYSTENLIAVSMGIENNLNAFETFRAKIEKHPDIIKVAGTAKHINHSYWTEITLFNNKEYEALLMPSGFGYLQTMEVKLLQGRYFESGKDTNCVILNEKYLKNANITHPINQNITVFGKKFRIIGVVGDFMQKGASHKVTPMVLTLSTKDFLIVAIKTKPGMLEEVNDYLKKNWMDLYPNQAYESFPQRRMIDNEKKRFSVMKTVFLSVSCVSLMLSLIGLYVLVSLIINKKIKEIGIRKVLGASVASILFLLGKNFLYIFVISSIIGSGCGFWLNYIIFKKSFELENHVVITPIPFLLASLAVTSVAILTIRFKVVNAANVNPAKSLRTD